MLRIRNKEIRQRKKKNDRIDASKICDCLRCDFLPESHMASAAIRERRRTLRYRNLLATNPDIDEGLCSLLRLCRETVVRWEKTRVLWCAPEPGTRFLKWNVSIG